MSQHHRAKCADHSTRTFFPHGLLNHRLLLRATACEPCDDLTNRRTECQASRFAVAKPTSLVVLHSVSKRFGRIAVVMAVSRFVRSVDASVMANRAWSTSTGPAYPSVVAAHPLSLIILSAVGNNYPNNGAPTPTFARNAFGGIGIGRVRPRPTGPAPLHRAR